MGHEVKRMHGRQVSVDDACMEDVLGNGCEAVCVRYRSVAPDGCLLDSKVSGMWEVGV